MKGPPPTDDDVPRSKVNAENPESLRRWPSPEVRIVLIYFVCASAWIIGSDLLLSDVEIRSDDVGLVQSVKGLNFVFTTALLLYMVLRRAYGGWRLAEQRRLSVIEQASEKFRNLSSRIQTLQEEERTRISREIHDELGQLLTGIKMELRWVENRISNLEGRELNGLIDKLVEISGMVDETIGSVKRISSGLRPSTLDYLGLGTALMGESVLFSERSGVPCSVVIETLPENLPPEVATTAFRIFQESLTNIARHAQARRVDATVKLANGCLQLVVCDDGKGIDPADIEDPHSLGLIGMRERAEHVGGEVVFKRGAQRGTEVILSIPLSPGVPPL